MSLSEKSDLVRNSYRKSVNGFYTVGEIEEEKRRELRSFFENNDWNALYFTDSRNRYQFYDLRNLWKDISIALDNDIKLVNLTSEPVSAAEVSSRCFGKDFSNIISNEPVSYDLRSIYAELYGGADGYCYSKEKVLDGLKQFVQEY